MNSLKHLDSSKLFTVLILLIYTIVFFGHDLVFLENDYTNGLCSNHLNSGGKESSDSEEVVGDEDHECPFCSGFLDSHDSLVEITPDSIYESIRQDLNGLVTFNIPFSTLPRDPPNFTV